jgi:heterodisulfide reductase subunit B
MLNVSYYPGCSLMGSAREFDDSVRRIAASLDVELAELNDWNCCGATAAHSLDEHLALALPARNLELAEAAGKDVVVPCASCFNRLKTAEKALLSGRSADLGVQFSGKVKIRDVAEFMSQPTVLEKLSAKVVKPLKGLKGVCYYGCLVSRPPKVTDPENCENPQSMDRIAAALGMEVYPWSYKTACCGGSHAIARPDIVHTLTQKLYDRALEAEAECFVVGCQMCQANLDMHQRAIAAKAGRSYYLPVFYFTELIGLACGHPHAGAWLERHFVHPKSLLRNKGLL